MRALRRFYRRNRTLVTWAVLCAASMALVGHVTWLPGVTIGDNVVVGAGSIVTRDLPSNVVAVGNPCHVLREVGERDREYYFKDRRIDWNEMRADEAAH